MIGISTTQCQPRLKLDRLIVGYTTTDHLVLDLDRHKDLSTTTAFVRMIQREYPDLGICLLVDSSPNLVLKHYHAVFDSRMSWRRITDITRTLAALGCLNKDYMKIRKFRDDLTLRISSIDRKLLGSEAPIPLGIVRTADIWMKFVDGINMYDHWNFYHGTYGDILYRLNGIATYLCQLSAFRPVLAQEVRTL